MSNDFVKVRFDLEVDEDGYPPVGSESLNAIVLGENIFQLDNTPFFVEGIAIGDVVEAFQTPESGDKYVFSKIISTSLDQSLSIIFLDSSVEETVFQKLKAHGCYCEYGEFRNGHLSMLAVSVPSAAKYEEIMCYLLELESQDILSVAELCFNNSQSKEDTLN